MALPIDIGFTRANGPARPPMQKGRLSRIFSIDAQRGTRALDAAWSVASCVAACCVRPWPVMAVLVAPPRPRTRQRSASPSSTAPASRPMPSPTTGPPPSSIRCGQGLHEPRQLRRHQLRLRAVRVGPRGRRLPRGPAHHLHQHQEDHLDGGDHPLNGGNVLRWISNPTYDSRYPKIINTIRWVDALAPSSLGTPLADATVAGNTFEQSLGWLLGYKSEAVTMQQTSHMAFYNSNYLYGTAGPPVRCRATSGPSARHRTSTRPRSTPTPTAAATPSTSASRQPRTGSTTAPTASSSAPRRAAPATVAVRHRFRAGAEPLSHPEPAQLLRPRRRPPQRRVSRDGPALVPFSPRTHSSC